MTEDEHDRVEEPAIALWNAGPHGAPNPTPGRLAELPTPGRRAIERWENDLT